MSKGEDICQRQGELQTDRGNYDSIWQECGNYVLPREAQFSTQSNEGEKRTERLFDMTAVTANERFAAIVENLLTPRTQIYHKLQAEQEELRENQEVKLYMDEVNRLLFTLRYRPRANYASQTYECYLSLGAFGNYALFIDEDLGRGMRYRAIHMSEVFWSENHQGVVDRVYRKFSPTAQQIVGMFGKKTPVDIETAAKNSPGRKFDIIHCVEPGSGRWAFDSYYVDVKNKQVITTGGYHSFPYCCGRYVNAPNEKYGRGPAQACLPAIRTLNEQKKTILRVGQRQADPPILLTEEGVMAGFSLKSGALNGGMMSSDGTPLAQAFKTGSDVPLGLEMMQLEGKAINDTFLVSLFQILVDKPNVTATEALIRSQEKGALLAPTVGRQQTDLLGPQIERELDICARAGLLPPMPDVLIEAGGKYSVVYESPLTQAQRAGEGLAITNTFQSAAMIAEVSPSSLDVIDFDASLKTLGEINGMPAKLLRSPEQILAIRQQREQQQSEQQAAEAALPMSQAVKNVAQAQAVV